jgi:hypothetical protein
MGRTAVRDHFMSNRMDCSCAARAISLACQPTANKLCMDGDLPGRGAIALVATGCSFGDPGSRRRRRRGHQRRCRRLTGPLRRAHLVLPCRPKMRYTTQIFRATTWM